MLVGREAELSIITAALEDARNGRGSGICVAGAPGIGKTSLLAAAEEAAPGFTRLRTTGVPSEIAIGHAGLAEILTPLRDWVAQRPPPQRAALETAMGWSAGESPPGRFLVGVATVSVLSMAAQERPILVLIDDLQWVDRESAVVLLFAARRMRHDAVLFLLARREGSVEPDVAGLDELELVGLTAAESAALLSQRSTAPVVLAQLVDRTAGNPLAMLEAAQQLSAEQLRGRRRADLSAPVDQERRVATGKPG